MYWRRKGGGGGATTALGFYDRSQATFGKSQGQIITVMYHYIEGNLLVRMYHY